MRSCNISAISTPIGVGGVAIVRVSGDSPLEIAKGMFRPAGKVAVENFEPYRMYVGEIDCGEFTDYGMCVYFRAPRSYTGEDMVEFHCHGGTAITRGVLKRTVELGCMPAGRGEFTKRAFLNGKLSLSSCEGLIDMINGESYGEVKAGYYLYKERLTRGIRDLQDKIADMLVLIDAALDFPDEVEEQADAERVAATSDEIAGKIQKLLSTYSAARKVKLGVKVAILGLPNAGKSSLLNALLGYERAIVSDIAGTTRDTVEGTFIYDGVRYELIDTAGIRECEGVEAEGVRRTKRALADCDVAVVVLDGSAEASEKEAEIINSVSDKPHIVVLNKCDIAQKKEEGDISVSALTGENVEALKGMLSEKVFGGKVDLSGDIISEERHFYALKAAFEDLKRAAETAVTMPLDAAAVELRSAWQSLGEITGETASESIIDEIFSKFCVGK